MKRIIKLSIWMLLVCMGCGIVASCNEDKGNYSYTEINKVDSFKNIKDNYTYALGERLTIRPKLVTSLNDTTDLDYAWYYYGDETWKVLSSEQYLDTIVGDPFVTQGKEYKLAYEVTNKETDIHYRKIFSLTISSTFTHGYVLLCDKEQGMDLDMIVLNGQEQFVPYLNVFEAIGSAIPRVGVKPYSVHIFKDETAPDPYATDGSQYSIYLLTDQYTTRIKYDDMTWKDSYDISNMVLKGSYLDTAYVAKGKKIIAEKMTSGIMNRGSASVHAYIYLKEGDKGNWYMYNVYPSWQLMSVPMNDLRSTNGKSRYKPSPFLSCGDWGVMFFNQDDNHFYYQTFPASNDYGTSNLYYTSEITNEASTDLFLFNAPNKGLLYQGERRRAGNGCDLYAILKTTDGGYQYIEYSAASSVSTLSSGKVRSSLFPTDTHVMNAKFFASMPNAANSPFLYYVTNDNQVYCANVSTNPVVEKNITAQIVTSGYDEITAFSFLLPNTYPGPTQSDAVRNSLAVATYNAALGKDTGGKLQIFTLSTVGGDAKLAKYPTDEELESNPREDDYQIEMSWQGLGKIVSLDYKP